MALHLVLNSNSLKGEREFNDTVAFMGNLPFVGILELGMIALPILFHAVYGFMIVANSQGPGGNLAHYGYTRNYLYYLQRWSGVLAFFYICFHAIDTTLNKRIYFELLGKDYASGHASIGYAAMAFRFAEPWYLALYIIGITAAAFHLGNGLFNFVVRWGLAIGKEAQKVWGVIGILVFLGLALLANAIAINFHLKGRDVKAQYGSYSALLQSEVAKHAIEEREKK
jgi:succinate dehydrogenase / fumarate reductase, cytochrome b subunit